MPPRSLGFDKTEIMVLQTHKNNSLPQDYFYARNKRIEHNEMKMYSKLPWMSQLKQKCQHFNLCLSAGIY